MCLLTGTVTIKSSQEWLKKLYSSLPVQLERFVQVFSPQNVGGAHHLAWNAYASFLAQKSNSLLAKKPEMDFLCRVAGTNQIPLAQEKVGIKDGQKEMAIVWVGKLNASTKKEMQLFCKSLSLIPTPVKWGEFIEIPKNGLISKEDFVIEESALSGW